MVQLSAIHGYHAVQGTRLRVFKKITEAFWESVEKISFAKTLKD